MRHVATTFVFLITTSIALSQTGSLLQWTSIASTSGNLRRVNVAVDRTFGQLFWDDGVGAVCKLRRCRVPAASR